MRRSRLLVIPMLVVFLIACGLSTGIQEAQTQVRGILTSGPTALNSLETMVGVTFPPSQCTPSTPSATGLGVGVADARNILQSTGQFTFTDGTVDGKQATVATLASVSSQTFTDISTGFSADFIGDQCNLSEIRATVPRTDQESTVTQGVAVLTALLTGVLPPGATLGFFTWLADNYGSVPVGGQKQTTLQNIQFTLSRDASTMKLEVLPAQ